MQDIKMNEVKLPKYWEVKKLDDLLDYIQPTKYIVKSTDYNNSYETPVLTAGKTFILGKTDETEGIFDSLPVIIFDDFTTANKLVNFKFKVKSSAMKILKPKDENVNLLFVYYYIQTIRISFDTHKRYWISVFSKLPIGLPSPETQQAIVSKIEELFSELDQGIADLKTAQAQLKVYRQSVLNLLATNENLMTIEQLISKLDQGWSPKCENKASINKSQWAVIKTSAVQQGYFVETENKILPNNLLPKKQHEIEVGDILITRAGPRVRVGVCCMVKHTRPKLINCDKVYRIKVNKELILPEYFEYIINTPKYQEIIEKMKSGISDSGLNLTQKVFVKITLPVPPIKEQHRIVQEIESRLSVADKMETDIEKSLQQAEALRQSILKKAFSGELV